MIVQSLPVRVCVRVYRACLAVLPGEFRAAYGADLLADFRDILVRSAGAGRGWVVPLLLVRAFWDLLRFAVGERWRARVEPNRVPGAPWLSRRGRRRQPFEVMMQWWNEVRQSARTLAKRPGFTLAAVLTLGLGIGANVAIFAVIDAVLIRPLPYPESERIVVLEHHAPGLNLPELENSEGTLKLYQSQARSFSTVARVDGGSRNLTGGDRPARIQTMEVSPEFFDVVQTMPELGRRFLPEDGVAGAPPVAILTYSGWQAHFAGDRDIIGRTVELDGVSTEIVGVMPRSFQYGDPENVLLVAHGVDANGGLTAFGIGGIARLKPGVTLEAAQREVTALQSRLTDLDPDFNDEMLKRAGWSASIRSLRDAQVEDVRLALWIVFGTVGFVLLIACANVANLFLVRAEARQREISVRTAMGASRARLAWLFLSESVVLGLAGGAVGTAIAALGVRALVAAGPAQLPRLHEIAIDERTLLFALAISAVASIAFGLLPLPRFMGRSLSGLRESRGDTGTRERHLVRRTLIAAQVALALVLLVGSGLMLRSFQRLRAMDLGMRPENVLTVGISYGERGSREATAQFYHRVLEQVAALPGVQTVGATNSLPVAPGSMNGGSFAIESRPREEGTIPPVAMFTVVTHDYFRAMGIDLLHGRRPELRDDETDTAVGWVNETFVRRFFPNEDVIGERVRLDAEHWIEVVGVVRDTRNMGLRRDIEPMVYLPLSTPNTNVGLDGLTLAIRTSGNGDALIGSIRGIIQNADPQVPLTTARWMPELVARAMADLTFTMTVLGIAAVVALLLGAIGLYGVISYIVTQRTREIGVRIALGAAPSEVRSMVVRQGLGTVIVGLVIGAAAALALTRVMRGILYEVSPQDPVTFIGVTIVLVLVSVFAAYLPARRAAALSPLTALRAE